MSVPSVNEYHERTSALFLGPKAENHEILRYFFDLIVSKQVEGRLRYFPKDEPSISSNLQESQAYKDKVDAMRKALILYLDEQNKYAIPFYSPRYSAHMSTDQSLPAILGYLSTMFYNPNNVAFEASPYTSHIEHIVGQQMCEMMRYNIDTEATDMPVAWGHITCDGTVANLESIWASRNLKFYPLSLCDAMKTGKLSFIADSFEVETATSPVPKKLIDCSTWELLNLKVSTVLEIPERLYKQYQISPTFLESAMKDYLIQTVSKDELMKKWGITEQPKIFVPITRHYSWPKGAALAGVGSENVIGIQVDQDARMDTDRLRTELEYCIEHSQAVYEVVAVIGTTEEGAVDRLEKIIDIRDEFQSRGLSFVVHVDAAWGGYFATMLPQLVPVKGDPDFVPHIGLREDTETQLWSLKFADSITIDPHKAGYIPYPAGGLCYRDGRMRSLLTWTAPYIDTGAVGENIGVYGVEGSKPGAAAASVYVAHQVIGTNSTGYGVLLGEATFTCRRFASHWATMSDDTTSFIVVPLNRLPSEIKPDSTQEKVNDEKERIRKEILGIDNSDLIKNKDAMLLLQELGSDLNVNAFACNFRHRDGTINTSIEEANWLNKRIFERLSVTSSGVDARSIPFYLTSTVFAQEEYGECATLFKKRLGLEGQQDLFVLRNVVMSPFATTNHVTRKMADVFRTVLEEEVENVRLRNEDEPSKHTFLMQGTDKLFLTHLPSFHMASSRRQIILAADLSDDDMKKYAAAKEANEGSRFTLQNTDPMLLNSIKDGVGFKALILIEEKGSATQSLEVDVANVNVIKDRSLDAEEFGSSYPILMPFYLYGTSLQPHIDHMLLLAPNIQLSAGKVQLELNTVISDADFAKGLIMEAKNIHEISMQPFPIMKETDVPDYFFFKAGYKFEVTVYRDPFPESTMESIDMAKVQEVVAMGTATLGGDIYIDSDRLNGDADIPERRTYSRLDLKNMMTQKDKEEWVATVEEMHNKLTNVLKG